MLGPLLLSLLSILETSLVLERALVLQEYLNCKVIMLNYVHVIFYSIAITPKHPCPCNEYQLSLYCYCYIKNITINTREALHCMTNLS